MSNRILKDGTARIEAVATALRRIVPTAEWAPLPDGAASDAAGIAADRPVRVGVLVDLEYAPSAGGHVKYWQRLAEAAVHLPEALDLTVHFHGPEKRELALSLSVRLALLPPVFSTARLMNHRQFPDHTDIAPWHAELARALPR